jgi:SAM-dependent methyltransferase
MQDDPWLDIPAGEYEAHMRAVGQAEVLRETFARVVAETRPARVAVLGCTTGADLALLDPNATELAVGVDINPSYIEIAAHRLRRWGDRLRLVTGDVARVELPPGPYDLVHVALLLEYVDPDVVFDRAHSWLGPAGTLSVVTQEPAAAGRRDRARQPARAVGANHAAGRGGGRGAGDAPRLRAGGTPDGQVAVGHEAGQRAVRQGAAVDGPPPPPGAVLAVLARNAQRGRPDAELERSQRAGAVAAGRVDVHVVAAAGHRRRQRADGDRRGAVPRV